MSKIANRQDSWTTREDKLLAETVIRHIEQGSTQLKAFEEVGEKLSRTPAACGFRWNSVVRKNYRNEIKQAREKRKNTKDKNEEGSPQIDIKKMNLSMVITFLQHLEASERDKLQDALEKEKQEKNEIKRKYESLQEEYNQLKEEYQSLKNALDKIKEAIVV